MNCETMWPRQYYIMYYDIIMLKLDYVSNMNVLMTYVLCEV